MVGESLRNITPLRCNDSQWVNWNPCFWSSSVMTCIMDNQASMKLASSHFLFILFTVKFILFSKMWCPPRRSACFLKHLLHLPIDQFIDHFNRNRFLFKQWQTVRHRIVKRNFIFWLLAKFYVICLIVGQRENIVLNLFVYKCRHLELSWRSQIYLIIQPKCSSTLAVGIKSFGYLFSFISKVSGILLNHKPVP